MAQLEALGLSISDACTSDANLSVSHVDAPSGSCPLVITRTYTVRDACLNASGATVLGFAIAVGAVSVVFLLRLFRVQEAAELYTMIRRRVTRTAK